MVSQLISKCQPSKSMWAGYIEYVYLITVLSNWLIVLLLSVLLCAIYYFLSLCTISLIRYKFSLNEQTTAEGRCRVWSVYYNVKRKKSLSS